MNILRNIENGLTALWARISGITIRVADNITGIIVAEYLLIGFFSVLTMIMVMFDWAEGAFFIAFPAAVIIILCWASSEAALGVLASMADIVLFGRRRVTTFSVDKIEKILNPLVVISLVFAFISCVVMMSGTEFITLKVIMVTFGVATFYFIFYNFVFKAKTKKLEFFMAMIVVWLLIENVILPNQIRPVTSWGRSWTEKIATSVNQSGQENSLKVLRAGATLYDQNFNVLRKTSSDVTVKFLGFETYNKTKEDFNKVVLPDSNGDYLRGDVVLVPVRYIDNYQDKDYKQVNYQPIPSRTAFTTSVNFKAGKNKITDIDLKSGDKVRYRNVKGVFKVKSSDGSFPSIKGDENHHAYANSTLEIYGVTDGSVDITVIPQ